MITLQYEHLVLTSFKIYLENLLLTKGGAFTNSSGYFYSVPSANQYYTYSLPYQPVVADQSVAGANIMSGLYVSGVFCTTGVSGLIDINYEKGQAYFSSPIANPETQLSGRFAISDFNIKLTSDPEEFLLLETKHFLKPKTTVPVTGLGNNDITYPVIYIKNYGGQNEEYAFGGTEKTVNTFRLLILADSQYALDGVFSIIKDRARTVVPMLTGITELPYNNLGGVNNGYNYKVLTTGRFHSSDSFWLDKVHTSTLHGVGYVHFRNLNPTVFVGVIDLSINGYRQPRS